MQARKNALPPLALLLLGLCACEGSCYQDSEECEAECKFTCSIYEEEPDPHCFDRCISDECVYSVRVPPLPAEGAPDTGPNPTHPLDAGYQDAGYRPPEAPDAGIDEACISACVQGETVEQCEGVYNCCFRFCHS